jgi:hypothetical protein
VANWDIQVQNVPNFQKGMPVLLLNFFHMAALPSIQGRQAGKDKGGGSVGQETGEPPSVCCSGRHGINAYHTQLNAANDTQESSKGLTKAMSTEVEIRRVETMTEQYRNLGFLINKSAEHPERIAPFFDLNVLRESNQVLFTGTLDPQETEAVLIHTFLADDELVLSIKGDPAIPAGTMVQFYLVPVAGGVNGTPVSVEANGAPLTITAADFGVTNYGTHRFLTAVNTHLLELHYEVELL